MFFKKTLLVLLSGVFMLTGCADKASNSEVTRKAVNTLDRDASSIELMDNANKILFSVGAYNPRISDLEWNSRIDRAVLEAVKKCNEKIRSSDDKTELLELLNYTLKRSDDLAPSHEKTTLRTALLKLILYYKSH